MGIILWLLFGALIGWLASLIMKTDGQQGALLNIVVGIVGAMIGGFLFRRDVPADFFDIGSILTALVGAVVLLGIYNLATRGRVR
ncbi:MAG: GlsB/YeaQ/YmgE family stress response membrane protein [Herpetosiphonaceae bacterium]|nr:GlsB/YeaQ/YmgE family stress response membrane protein [Herpetosiphonaceae bacterium]